MNHILRTGLLAVALAATFVPGASARPTAFHGKISPLSPTLRAQMNGVSWHSGCPVPLSQLRLIALSYRGFDQRSHTGQLVVNGSVAKQVVGVFRTLYRENFPIRRMRLVDAYGGSDFRSIEADNTSAFNCRGVPGAGWSEHAYGRAIDINPLENPEVRRGVVSPPGGRAYLDRRKWKKGMIHSGDKAVSAFAAVGWHWGGYWHSLQDYQHFSWNGQ